MANLLALAVPPRPNMALLPPNMAAVTPNPPRWG